MTRYFTNVGRF